MPQQPRRSIQSLRRATLALILAGGRGTRLHQLTARRSKPSVPFGGKFRIIDFALSNCVNSGIRSICILTQYKAHSLMRHVQRGWTFNRPEFGEFVELIPAQQRVGTNWYLGTADAVYQNLDIIDSHQPEYILILAGDHVYKMDYNLLIAQHLELGADVTVGCVEVDAEQANQFGVMRTDAHSNVVAFAEKPGDASPWLVRPGHVLASMGIYLFSFEFLSRLLKADAASATSSHDFGKDIIPSLIGEHRVAACPLGLMGAGGQRYWRDVGTVDSYWEANMDLIGVTPELNLYDPEWPIFTWHEQVPPAKFVFDNDKRRGMAVDSLVDSGCIVSGGKVERSLLFTNVRVNSYSHIQDSVILPGVEIGRSCEIRHAVIDKDCKIPPGTAIGKNPEEDRKRFYVSPKGIVLVCPDMLTSNGSRT